MIEISGLKVSYDGEEVLKGVDASFPKGKISVIIGPNGCGKSTTVKAIMRLLPIEEGKITVNGKDLCSFPQKALSQTIAYVAQSKNIPDISVYNLVMHGRFPYLTYPRHYREEDRKVVADALKWAGLEKLSQRKMEELSGGQRQKAYMAMALAQDTDVILLDEPTAFMDVKNQYEMLEQAKRLTALGKTVIMVLHDFEAVLHYADKVVLMDKGLSVLSGSAEEVLRSEKTEEVFGIKTGFYEDGETSHIYLKNR